MNTPDLSIILIWDFCDTIQQMLELNRCPFSAHDLEILVVNPGGDGRRLRQLLADSQAAWTGVVDLSSPCNHGFGVNIGMHFSRAQNLFILGPGHILQSDFIGELTQLLTGNVYVLAKKVIAPWLDSYWSLIKEQAGSASEIEAT